MIIDRRSTADIKEATIKDGMLTLRSDGLEKFKKGITSLEEVLRETSEF
jgi:type IV pilus assembly protein PilB